MNSSSHPHQASDLAVSYYWSGDAIRSRSVSDVVLTGTLDVPAPPARLLADWKRDVSTRLGLDPGDVAALPLARARMRWPEYRQCVEAATGWLQSHGLRNLLAKSDIALMACHGARYHHDAAQYGGAAFCNLFLSQDCGLDVHFSATGHRIALTRGTVVVFDTAQPHAVVRRGSSHFDAVDFPPDCDCTQVFLTWELPIEDLNVARALGIHFDTDASAAGQLDEEQVWLNGEPVMVCPDTGCWRSVSQKST